MGRIALLALAAFALFALLVNVILFTDSGWVIALTVAAEMVAFTLIGFDVRRLMAGSGDGGADEGADASPPRPAYDGAPVQPGTAFTGLAGDDRAVVVVTAPAAAGDVLGALRAEEGPEAARLSLMVVVPEGFGHRNHDDEHFYADARHAESETVDALRRAGVTATGHVGDHSASQAITDAIALFGTTRVVVLAHGADTAAALRADVDPVALGRRTGAHIELVELRADPVSAD